MSSPATVRPPVAMVTGAAGQDGSYLVDRLLGEGLAVCAVIRPGERDGLPTRVGAIEVVEVDLREREQLSRLVEQVGPNEIYNLGGLSSVAHSWAQPQLTAEVCGLAALTLLDAAAHLSKQQPVRFLQASSAEIFGEPSTSPQDESTPICPVNPYGAAKAFAHHCVGIHRSRGLHAASAILYNHESPRRPLHFVTRKITAAAARIARHGAGTFTLGNLEARRDWGWAPDYVDAMVLAARHEEPLDVVIASGRAHSVADFAATAFAHVGIEDWRAHVVIDPALVRPVDPPLLVGDPTRARRELGWAPTKSFEQVVAAMVEADLATWDSPHSASS